MKNHVSDKLLSSYVDGDLKPKLEERITKHLKGCKACSLKLEEFKSIKATASGFESVEVPEGMLVGIKARLADEGIAVGAPVPVKPRRQFGFWHGLAIGTALTTIALTCIIIPKLGLFSAEDKPHEELTLGFSAEEAGPPLGLARATSFGHHLETPATPRTYSTPNYAGYPTNGNSGHVVFANHTQPVIDSGNNDTSPRTCIIMEPLDEEARRRMLAEKGVTQIFPFEGPDLRFTKTQRDSGVMIVPLLEADTNTRLNKLYYK